MLKMRPSSVPHPPVIIKKLIFIKKLYLMSLFNKNQFFKGKGGDKGGMKGACVQGLIVKKMSNATHHLIVLLLSSQI
jgi:hypothetical protein